MAMQSGFIKRIRDIMRMDAGINGDAQRIEQMVWMLFLKVYDAKEDDWELNEDDYESIIPEELRWRNWAKADSNGHAMTGDKLLNFVNNILFPVLKGNNVKDGDAVLYEGIKVTPDTPIKKAIVKSTFEDANNYMKDGVYLRQVIDVIDEIEFDDVKESHAFGFVYEEILRELQSAGSSGEFYTPRAVTESSHRVYGIDDKTAAGRKDGRLRLRNRWIYHFLAGTALQTGNGYHRSEAA